MRDLATREDMQTALRRLEDRIDVATTTLTIRFGIIVALSVAIAAIVLRHS